jgi:alpha-aminoadipate carrier protein LysW
VEHLLPSGLEACGQAPGGARCRLEEETYALRTGCRECDGAIEVPDDAMPGELVTCPDCGVDYEVETMSEHHVSLKVAETAGEDWGE